MNSGKTYSGTYFVLTADLNLNNKPWTPISNKNDISGNGYGFQGAFDGAGHTVSGLAIGSQSSGSTIPLAGLFGYVDNGGAVENTGYNYGTIETCYATGAVTVVNSIYIGGFAGISPSTDSYYNYDVYNDRGCGVDYSNNLSITSLTSTQTKGAEFVTTLPLPPFRGRRSVPLSQYVHLHGRTGTACFDILQKRMEVLPGMDRRDLFSLDAGLTRQAE